MKKSNNKFALLWYSRPRAAIALMLVIINLLVIALFTGVLCLMSGNAFFDELAYIFTFTMSADGIYDFINSQDDLKCFVVKILLAVIQMVIFSGALIGFTTDVLQSAIDKRINNVGKLSLSNHYVFLNWSSIGPHLIYDLSFLEGKKNVVILAEQDREEVINSIQNIFAEHKVKMKNIRLFVKNGSPKSSKHLLDVSLDKAKNVGILQSTTEEGIGEMSGNDLQSLKTLFTIINVAKNANIVVETESHDTVVKIENLLNSIDRNLTKRVLVFSHNAVLGNVMGKVLVNKHYDEVYRELLSYEGCEFYGIDTMDIETALETFNDCIPVINYDDDGNETLDQLYILSDNAQTLGKRAKPQKMVVPINFRENIASESFTVFIVADKNGERVVLELEKVNKEFGHNIKFETFGYDADINNLIEKIKATTGKKKILLLSADGDAVDSVDAEVFLTALKLKLNNVIDADTTVCAEVSNPTNVSALNNFGVMSVIVSKQIISLFMVQLMTHPISKNFYRDLMSTNSDESRDFFDLEVLSAKELIQFEDATLHFSCKSEFVQSFYHASGKSRMCLGVIYQDGSALYMCDKMDVKEDITLSPDDQLILIKY